MGEQRLDRRGVRVRIEGVVQGVGYRFWTERVAGDLGLTGWVRNRRDGSVEAVFAGPAAVVAQMVDACRGGPPGARVVVLDVREGSAADLRARRAGELFSVLPTV